MRRVPAQAVLTPFPGPKLRTRAPRLQGRNGAALGDLG